MSEIDGWTECAECLGAGEVQCDCGGDNDCPRCEGSDFQECPDCEGIGEICL